MNTQSPEPASTAVVIIGASEWPFADQFEASPQFENSATQFREFILSDNGFGLPKENLLWLFDTKEEQSVVVRYIAKFLSSRQAALKSNGGQLSDVVFYYVGHGGFDTGGASTYFLALRQTNTVDSLSSSLAVSSLRRALRESTRDVRHYLILDCCFAAAALAPYLQLSAAAQGMVAQIQDSFPPAGTALLCASGAIIPAKAKRGAKYTMFSEALLEILNGGVPNGPNRLSLAEIGTAVRSLLKSRYGDDAVRPEVHSPEQAQGSVADVPLFKNVTITQGILATNLVADGILKSDSNADDPVHDTTLAGLFTEFDESHAPAKIPFHSISEASWEQIPTPIKGMLKKLEALLPSRMTLRSVRLINAVALTSNLFFVFLLFSESENAPSFLYIPHISKLMGFSTLGIAGTSAIGLLILIAYYYRIFVRGERSQDRLILRRARSNNRIFQILFGKPVNEPTPAWERLEVMNLLRQPRTTINYEGRLYSYERLRKLFVFSGCISLFSVLTFGLFFVLLISQ